MLGQPLFPGESGIDQLVEIIKVLGTPTREQIRTMNPNYMEHKFPQIKPHPFSKVRLPCLLEKLLCFCAQYQPCSRFSARLIYMPLISSLACSNTRRPSDCQPLRPWFIPSSMNFGIQTPAFRILDMPTVSPKICLRSLTFLYMVSWLPAHHRSSADKTRTLHPPRPQSTTRATACTCSPEGQGH